MKNALFALSLVIATSMFSSGCYSKEQIDSPSPMSNTPMTAMNVAIMGFAFNPENVTVKIGSSITWTNQDRAPHTITSDDGSWDSGKIMQNGKYTHKFDTAGTFTYYCTVHPSMKGTIIVTP
nr:cupredoxin family copper-binding protein [uncultured Tolumonas sp.]